MSLLPGRSRQRVEGCSLPESRPTPPPARTSSRRSGGALQGVHQQTRGFTRLPLRVLPGTAPLCRGASPATSPSQAEGSGQIARCRGSTSLLRRRAMHRPPAPRRLASAPQEQRTSTYMHIIGRYVKGPLQSTCARPSPPDLGSTRDPGERDSAFGSTARHAGHEKGRRGIPPAAALLTSGIEPR